MILLVITCLAILRSPSLSPFPVHHSQHPVEALTPHLHICGTLPVIYERNCDERLHSQQPTIGWMARPSLFQHSEVLNSSTHALLAGTCNCTGRFESETQLATSSLSSSLRTVESSIFSGLKVVLSIVLLRT